jgi:hypothetical protein
MTRSRAVLPRYIAWAAIPGTLFWGLVIAGVLTEDSALIGAAVGLFAVTAIAVITLKVRASAAARADRRRVWTTGEPGRARVVSIRSPGGGINGHPRVDFELEVTRAHQAPYRTRLNALISELAVPRIQPGCEIEVRVDPDDRENVLIDEALTPYGYR